MSKAERDKYYKEYNARYTPKQWDSISTLNQQPAAQQNTNDSTRSAAGSVSFSIKNNGLLSRTYFIAGNVLTVGALKRSYYGFPAGTEIYLYDDGKADKKGKLLHTVSATDEGKMLAL